MDQIAGMLKGFDASELEEMSKMWEDAEVNSAMDRAIGEFFGAEPKTEVSWRPGDEVCLTGLKGRAILNGRRGRILGHAPNGRYKVSISEDDSGPSQTVSVRAEHLCPGQPSASPSSNESLRKLELPADEKRGICLTLFEASPSSWTASETQRNIEGSGGLVWPAAQALLDFFTTWLDSSLRQPGGAALRVVELGAGLGAPGLYLAKRGCDVELTDVPDMLPLLRRNAEANFSICVDGRWISEKPGSGAVTTAALRWSTERENLEKLEACDVAIAADCTNEDSTLPALVATVRALCRNVGSRAFVASPCRAGEIDGFVEALKADGIGHKVCWRKTWDGQECEVLEVLQPWASQIESASHITVRAGWNRDPAELSVDISSTTVRLEERGANGIPNVYEVALLNKVNPSHVKNSCRFRKRPYRCLEMTLVKTSM